MKSLAWGGAWLIGVLGLVLVLAAGWSWWILLGFFAPVGGVALWDLEAVGDFLGDLGGDGGGGDGGGG